MSKSARTLLPKGEGGGPKGVRKDARPSGRAIGPTDEGAALQQLFAAAKAAQMNAYAPYSRFKVGAALRTPSGAIFAGCNVENAAYPQGDLRRSRRDRRDGGGWRAADRRDPRHRRRRGLVHAVRRLPPAHPRIRRPHDADPYRRPGGRARRPSRSASFCRSRSDRSIWRCEAPPSGCFQLTVIYNISISCTGEKNRLSETCANGVAQTQEHRSADRGENF